MKKVTKARILKAHEKLCDYNDYLARDDMPMLEQMMMFGIEYVSSLGGVSPSDPSIEDIEVPEKTKAIIATQFAKAVRVHRKRMKIDEIQRHHEISGLVMGQSEIGGGYIDHWKTDGEMCLTDGDIWKLREDRPRMVRFWADHVVMNGLPVYRWDEDHWVLSSVEAAQVLDKLHGWAYGWAMAWENVYDYKNENRVNPVSREICLVLGDGCYQDCPERLERFCATNESEPSI